MEENLNPLSIMLVSTGTKGDKLLFWYPCDRSEENQKFSFDFQNSASSVNPYIIRRGGSSETHGICDSKSVAGGYLSGLSDDVVSYLFTVKQELCDQRFELKINDARFVGFPLTIDRTIEEMARPVGEEDDEDARTILLLNVVFVLRASASKSIVSSYQELSKRIALALVHEERRVQYLSEQAKVMSDCQEEVMAMAESCMESPYGLMLQRSELAQHLKNIFMDILETGSCSLHINGWVEISFCLPEKVYNRLGIPVLTSESLDVALKSLRPFHSFLLLEEPLDIIASLPVDSSPALCRLLRNHSPLISLQTMSTNVDLPLSQVFMLVKHLVLWGKAIVIYPVCESNVYVVSPSARIGNHVLVESFAESFSGKNLLSVLAEFNPPLRMGEFMATLLYEIKDHTERIQVIMWLLQRRLIMQLHNYVYLCLPSQPISKLETNDQKAASALFSEDEIAELKKEFTGSFEVFEEIMAICRSVENTKHIEEELRLFINLTPYFNGEHHLEEIMYRKNVKRGDLFRVLDRFRAILVMNLKQDNLASGLD